MNSADDHVAWVGEFTVGSVAKRLEIPVATLRSWNQRYGIGPSRHAPGRHRYYTREDIAVVVRMVELVRAGATPASAAQAARATSAPISALEDVPAILAAAQRLDPAELLPAIVAHFSHHGVVDTWNLLCRPVFAAIIDRQDAGAGFIDVEHMLSWAVTSALHRVAPLLRDAARYPPILLACTGGEQHTLPLEVLRAALAEHGEPAVFLGQSVPDSALTDALARQQRAPVVVLWAQTPDTARLRTIVAAQPRAARLLLAGPGWSAGARPPGVGHLDSLEDAVAELTRERSAQQH
ncbi:MerR family transcriptional regulator [Nocardia sp. NPDC050712]|uniref:MerR family transcriptional regulator n=1 Tax=Nocardia sp. NPDC050712 TaxID=3155518 RepID=UPI0033BFD940